MYAIKYTKYFPLHGLTLSVITTLNGKDVIWLEPDNTFPTNLFWIVLDYPDRVELIQI